MGIPHQIGPLRCVRKVGRFRGNLETFHGQVKAAWVAERLSRDSGKPLLVLSAEWPPIS